jgi:exonuclease VII small subunit
MSYAAYYFVHQIKKYEMLKQEESIQSYHNGMDIHFQRQTKIQAISRLIVEVMQQDTILQPYQLGSFK